MHLPRWYPEEIRRERLRRFHTEPIFDQDPPRIRGFAQWQGHHSTRFHRTPERRWCDERRKTEARQWSRPRDPTDLLTRPIAGEHCDNGRLERARCSGRPQHNTKKIHAALARTEEHRRKAGSAALQVSPEGPQVFRRRPACPRYVGREAQTRRQARPLLTADHRRSIEQSPNRTRRKCRRLPDRETSRMESARPN